MDIIYLHAARVYGKVYYDMSGLLYVLPTKDDTKSR